MRPPAWSPWTSAGARTGERRITRAGVAGRGLEVASTANMDLNGKIVVVTGAASGIGRAAALRFAREGAAGIVVADLDAGGLKPVAEATGGLAVACDVSREADVQRLVAEA